MSCRGTGCRVTCASPFKNGLPILAQCWLMGWQNQWGGNQYVEGDCGFSEIQKLQKINFRKYPASTTFHADPKLFKKMQCVVKKCFTGIYHVWLKIIQNCSRLLRFHHRIFPLLFKPFRDTKIVGSIRKKQTMCWCPVLSILGEIGKWRILIFVKICSKRSPICFLYFENTFVYLNQ